MADERYDIVVIGGGIVGLSVAMEMTRRFPQLLLLVAEKEAALASHQTGHNSGVIHSGVYYKPGSVKARTCVAGAGAMVEFCQQHGVPFEVCGKVIVATAEAELPRLQELLQRGQANGISGLRLLSPEELRAIEPHCRALGALHVPTTAITDYVVVSRKYADLATSRGAQVRTACEVVGFRRDGTCTILETTQGSFATRYVINCAGLQSDKISRIAGGKPEFQIVPFRGEYYDLIAERHGLVRGLIYPVPDPRFPFLGVHFTRRIHGGVDAGPNAVLAFKREGYKKGDFSLRDTLDALTYPGLWRMAAKYWRSGLDESYRASSKAAFVKALQRLVPEIQASDLVPGGSGVRAQALQRDGTMVDDFQFTCAGNMLHVGNVPSPAATASIPIGRAIVDMAQEHFGLGAN
ncbi:MAG: L-2-hydroxyglutarate oxidase [Acidobacteria bacterium]|nr:MAG: L-2-hydroxyglutarate oxidase [Acidobacteriota bacterium]